jgi:hypothetical protein
MLELSLIVFGVWAIVAFLSGKVGYRMGAKRAAAEIADFFLHEITSDVAWLADAGFQVWISPGGVPFRNGERLTYEKAEALANVLGTFERKIAFGFMRETEDEKERRFTTSLNRMQRYWRAYGKL